MAPINGQITMTTIEGRPCWVEGRRAIFHRWSDSARPVKDGPGDDRMQKWSVHAIVEYEDGIVEREWPNKIQFADSAGIFAGFEWEAMEERRDALPWVYPEPAAEPAAQEPLQEDQETQEAPDVWPACETCAHGTENEDFCKLAEYDCKACTVRGCYCKRCKEFDRWEPKEGTA